MERLKIDDGMWWMDGHRKLGWCGGFFWGVKGGIFLG